MIRWMILLSALAPAGAAAQDRGAEAGRAAQALLALKDGDEDGFDAQADVLLQLGADALGPIEEALQGAPGEKAFRLRRVRDMIWYPVDLKGAVTIRMGNPEKAAKLGLQLGEVSLSFNGQAVSGHLEYSRLLQEAEKAGQTVARVELFFRGRRRTVEIEGLRTGGSIANYPHVLAYYVHQGHRSAAWDEAVQEAIAPWNEDSRGIDTEKLTAAVRAGCRDPLVLFKAMAGQVGRNAPDEAVKLWTEAREGLRTRAYGGSWHRECLYIVSRAMLECGRTAEALPLNEEVLRAWQQAGDAVGAANARVWRAIMLEEKDPALGVDLLHEAITALSERKVHHCWHHNFMMHLLRRREKWDDVANYARLYGTDKEENPAPLLDAHDMMGRFKNRTLTLVPSSRLYSSAEAVRRGRPDGLSGSYHPAPDFQGTPVVRIDPDVSFRWGHEPPLADFPKDQWSARWTGLVDPEFTDTYTFLVRSDDGARLWVDGREVIDQWQGQAPTYTESIGVPLTAGRKAEIKLEYFDAIKGAQVELYWDCPSFAAARKTTTPWALVYRQGFEAPAVRHAFQDSAPAAFAGLLQDSPGRLRIDGRKSDLLGTSWAAYDGVRIQMDLTLPSGAGEGRSASAGLRACLDRSRQTEVGFGVEWPRAIEAYLYYDRRGAGFLAPWLDLRRPQRLALEVHQGKAAYFVNGRMIDVQFFPPSWSGAWGLRASGAPIEVDNLEIYVPDENPADPARVRALYDAAAAAFLKQDPAGAVASLEQAAALQPRVDELGRLCAAYLAAARDGRAALDKRLAGAAHPQSVRMLLEAEEHLDLLGLDPEAYEAVLRAKAGLEGGATVDPDALKALRESPGTGRLALHGRLVRRLFERGRADVGIAQVEAAYRHAIAKDPGGLVHKYRLAEFLAAQKEPGQAQALLKEIRTRAPKAELPAAKDAKKPR